MNAGKKTPWASDVIAEDSAVKLLRGGTLPVGCKTENFKPRYLDEYTGEVLPAALIHAAIVQELNYFNGRVWEITSKEDMMKHKDYIFVRSRWIMCNKGDASEFDCRARLVVCEVNKTGLPTHVFCGRKEGILQWCA